MKEKVKKFWEENKALIITVGGVAVGSSAIFLAGYLGGRDSVLRNVDLNLLEVINNAKKLGAQSYHYNLNQEGFAIEDFGKVGQEMIDVLGLDPKREVLGCIVFDRNKV